MNYDYERESLEFIYAAADDYLMALEHPEFCEEYGGIEKFLEKLKMCVEYHTETFNTSERESALLEGEE